MKSIAELISPYRGSQATYENVKRQIAQRWGNECAESYDPRKNDCMPLVSWASYNHRVRPGEKALKSITFVEVKDARTGEVIRKVKRTVNLFHKNQVEKIS